MNEWVRRLIWRIVEMVHRRETEIVGENPDLLLFCPPQIPGGLPGT
jgi:hypothetical protein